MLEARALGLESAIRSTQAVDARFAVPFDELIDLSVAEAFKRDNSTFLPDVAGSLCASHPKSCQTLAEEAVWAGAQLVRGVGEVPVRTGNRPAITFRNGIEANVRPRLIVGADGRTSTVRKQSGIQTNAAPSTHLVAGLLVEGASRWPEDLYTVGVEGDLQSYVFPQGHGRLRLYTGHANEQAARWGALLGASDSSRRSRRWARSRTSCGSATSRRQDRARRSAANTPDVTKPMRMESS